jgi:hypothetical protein
MARPRGTGKTSEEKFISRNIRFPPALWAEIERRVPEGKRSTFIRRAIEDRLAILRAKARREKPIWERIAEAAQSIPEEELKRLPPDASVNIDHYLYGAPKREP